MCSSLMERYQVSHPHKQPESELPYDCRSVGRSVRGIFPDGRTGVSSKRSQSLPVLVITFYYKVSSCYTRVHPKVSGLNQ
jgi:hypothetical protein